MLDKSVSFSFDFSFNFSFPRSCSHIVILVCLFFGGYSLPAHAANSAAQDSGKWWNIPYPERFDAKQLRPQSRLKVKGNLLVDENGKTVILRGFNIADLDKLDSDRRWNETLIEEVSQWGANTIRIPVHPVAWRNRGKDWYLQQLDQAVLWANARSMYLIIDWHSIGNLNTQMFQHPMYRTDPVETANFWAAIAFRYRDVPTVAIYELFNEPTDDFVGNGNGSLGKASWPEWRESMEDLIDIIKVYNPDAVPLVTGFNWGYDLSNVVEQPIRREGVAYAIHPYPQKAKVKEESIENFKNAWQKQWGYVADHYPLIATEFGWVREDGYGSHVPVIHNNGTYGPAIIEFMAERNISWTAWVFDPQWSPVIIKDWQFTPSEQGAFFKQVLSEK